MNLDAFKSVLVVVFVIAFVTYAIITTSQIQNLQNVPHVSFCTNGSIVCGSGISKVGQIPILVDLTTTAINPSGIFTDSNNINIGILKMYNDTQEFFVGLKAPDDLLSDSTWTLPSGDGLNGQVLQTNGSGFLQFSNNFIDNITHIVDSSSQTKKLNFNIGGTTNTSTTIQTIQTLNQNFILPDSSGLGIVERSVPLDGRVIIGSNNVNLFGTAKLQLTAYNDPSVLPSTLNSAAQVRVNQYGNSTAAPGLSCFKSRGQVTNVVPNLVPVALNDHIMDISASGVTPGLGQSLSGFLSFVVSSVPVSPPGIGWLGTDFRVQTVSKNGGVNGRRPVFCVSSEAILQLRESSSPQGGSLGQPAAGIVALIGGSAIVINTTLPTDARILLTIQPGPAPSGQIYVSNITANTSFTITSTNAGDTCNVYYQIWQPISIAPSLFEEQI
jgi:hypothetical protein